MSLTNTFYPMLSTGSTKEKPPNMTEKLLMEVKHLHKTYQICII